MFDLNTWYKANYIYKLITGKQNKDKWKQQIKYDERTDELDI